MDRIYSKAQCFFSLKTQFDNVGDALINREMVRLSAAYGHAHVDLSRCPTSFVETLGINEEANTYSSFKDLIKALFRCRLSGKKCYYFLSPGGYFGEISIKELPSKIANTLVLIAFRLLGVRICLVGVSYERLGPRNIILQKIRYRLLYRHILRDKISIEYAKGKGIGVDGLMPDLAFNVFKNEPKVAQNSIPKRVAFSFRTDQYETQKDQVFASVAAFLNVLGKDVEYTIVTQVGRDNEAMIALQKLIEEKTGQSVSYINGSENIETCSDAYRDCDLVVANRLHALLLASSEIGHLIAMTGEGKNRKIDGILADLGCDHLKITAGETSPEKIETLIKASMSQYIDGKKQYADLHQVFKEMLA